MIAANYEDQSGGQEPLPQETRGDRLFKSLVTASRRHWIPIRADARLNTARGLIQTRIGAFVADVSINTDGEAAVLVLQIWMGRLRPLLPSEVLTLLRVQDVSRATRIIPGEPGEQTRLKGAGYLNRYGEAETVASAVFADARRLLHDDRLLALLQRGHSSQDERK
jgi:hypothetical protein